MKKAIIVGATSGIGRNLTKLMVTNGYKVGITGRRLNLLAEIKAENPDQIYYKSFDVKNTATINHQLSELVSELGGLDILVISSGTGDLNEQLDFEIEKNCIDTNVSGFTAIADWAYTFFQHQKAGQLVAISSIGGIRGNHIAPSYSASKAYQINYLEGLRIKAFKSKLPITITDIRPGFVDTDMAKGDGLFWVVPVEKAAKQIFVAIDRKKNIAYISKRWKLIAGLFNILPNKLINRL